MNTPAEAQSESSQAMDPVLRNQPPCPSDVDGNIQGKMLLVSWGVPPLMSGSSAIVENLSHQFSPEEMVIAGEAPLQASDYNRATHLPRVHYLAWHWRHRGAKTVRRLLTPVIAYQLWRLARRNSCDTLMAVFPDEAYLLASYLVARACKLRFYTYFHNTYLENRRGPLKLLARWLQPRVFSASPIVFVMSEGMQQVYKEMYPHVRFEPLVHTFSGPVPAFEPVPLPGSPLKVAFLGHLNPSNRDSMERFGRVLAELPDCHFTTYSGTAAGNFSEAGIRGPLVTHTRVPLDKTVDALRQHDVLYLPHGLQGDLSQVEYDTIFPTRTISCLLSGRPILAHSPPDSFLTRWLRQHDCAEIVDQPDVARLRQALERLRLDDDRRQQLARNALEASRQFHGPVVAQRFRQLLNEAECDIRS